MTTPEELDALQDITSADLESLLAKASQGPWRVENETCRTVLRAADGTVIMCDEQFYPWVPENKYDWDLIALASYLARKNIALRARVAELEAEVHALQEVVNAEEERANDANTRARVAEAELARRGQGVQVKPLEWCRVGTYGGDCLDASALGVSYRIITKEDDTFWLTWPDVVAPTLEAAKAAAQADYEARIRAALVSPGDGWRDDPAKAFDKADWFWRTMDPDDCGDSPEEAVNRAMVGQFCVCEVASSYSGPTRYGFIAPVLDPDSDDEEFVHFATQEEAIAAAKARSAPPASEGA